MVHGGIGESPQSPNHTLSPLSSILEKIRDAGHPLNPKFLENGLKGEV